MARELQRVERCAPVAASSEAGVARAKWILAEGADACKMQRSIPLEKAMDDIIVAYGQNGEALRPEQGYPLRLVIPGWEGNSNVKWLRRLKLVDQPYMTRDETSKYTDPMPDGTARQFTFVMEAKSVVTFPSGGQKLAGAGWYEITGLAWSGRGRIERAEISIDGGATWQEAALSEPRLPAASHGSVCHGAGWRNDRAPRAPTNPVAALARSSDRGARGELRISQQRYPAWKVMADGSVTDAGLGSLWRTFCRRRFASSKVGLGRTPRLRNPRRGYHARSRWHGPAGRPRNGGRRPRGVFAEMRALSWSKRRGWRRTQAGETRRRARESENCQTAQDRRQLLAVRDDNLGLREPGDAA
jgi:DMSO/TMAO reductase YedYZ molybdopterin-dependent catalytic subunit